MLKQLPRNDVDGDRPKPRAIAYCRVSTVKQEKNELSLATQQEHARRFAERMGFDLIEFAVEKGLSAMNARRPVLQQLVSRAGQKPPPYEVVIMWSTSRFFRNLVEGELYRARLASHGVDLLSATQDLGTGKEGKLIRHIIGAVDEFASDVNAEQVASMMIANAERGWWNGSTPPFGYGTVVVARVGSKDKKALAIQPDEAAIVQRIFRLYLVGEASRPLGLKKICTKLNGEGVSIRGKSFLCSTVSDLLKRTTYKGEFFYNRKNSRTGEARHPSEWVKVTTPVIVSSEEFDAVAARLALNNSKITAPRTTSSPTLLAGIGICGHPGCGAGLLLSTGKGGQYRYYTCQRKRTQSVDACASKPKPMAVVDDAVLTAIERQVLAPDRLPILLANLLDRSDEAAEARRADLARLRTDKTRAEAAIRVIWETIEGGAASASDPDVAERMALHRERIKQLGNQIRVIEGQEGAPARRITPEVLGRFSNMVRQALRGPDHGLRQDYLRLLVASVEMHADGLVIRGSKRALELAVAAKKTGDGKVLTFAQNWCARNDSNVRPSDS